MCILGLTYNLCPIWEDYCNGSTDFGFSKSLYFMQFDHKGFQDKLIIITYLNHLFHKLPSVCLSTKRHNEIDVLNRLRDYNSTKNK